MTDPFRISPQNIPGGDLARVLSIVNKNMRDLRRDVTKLPVVLDVPEDITATYGHASAAVIASMTIIGGTISPPARGVRVEMY